MTTVSKVNSKVKGSTFENKISKMLSKKLSPFNFKRVPSSGAILGGRNVINLNKYNIDVANVFIGDIICINEEPSKIFKFNIECKFYKNIPTLENLFSDNCLIYTWMNESEIDALKSNKIASVIFKFNRSKIYFATKHDLPINSLKLKNNINVCDFEELLEYKDYFFM